MLQIWQGEAEHIASILKRQHQLASGEVALSAETKRCKSEAKRDRKRVRERQRERKKQQIDRAQGQDDSKQTTTMSETTQKPDEEFKFFFV